MVATWRASHAKLGFHMSEPYAKIQKGVPRSQGVERLAQRREQLAWA